MYLLPIAFLAATLPQAGAAAGADRRGSLDSADVQEYATAVDFVVSQVAEHYQSLQSDGSMRRCSSQEIVMAALRGLYEAVAVPMPSVLKNSVNRARSGEELRAVILRARRELGPRKNLDRSRALLASVEAMCQILDRYSCVVSSVEMVRGIHNESGYGVGMELRAGDAGTFVVKSVVPGSPAQRRGLRPGDVVTAINHRSAAAVPAIEAMSAISPGGLILPVGINGAEFELGFTRPGWSELRTARLRAESFVCETILGVGRDGDGNWRYWVDDSARIAHVRLGRLVGPSQDGSAGGTSDDLAEVLRRLDKDGMRGLILDLRWCPGGSRDEAIKIARLFLDAPCTIVTVRDDKVQKAVAGEGAGRLLKVPMVVLVNGDTCGGGELIAAALQDNRRARVAGQRTLGKSSIQLAIQLPLNGMYLKLTNGAFVRPNGKNLQRFPDSKRSDDWGVRPDPRLEFRVSTELAHALEEWWSWQTLRPASSNEALPLDDLSADPQLHACLRAFRSGLTDSR
jgi:C-terminal processing protease CtpA/Prc